MDPMLAREQDADQMSTDASITHRLLVESEGRLDKIVSDQIDGLSRSRIQALIEGGHVVVDDKPADDRSTKVRPGQIIVVSVPAPKPAKPEAQSIPLLIVYEDDDIIVLNKQAGLVVHPGAGNPDGTLVNALLAHLQPASGALSGIGGVLRPGIVHRLDKDTSGLMVVAKNDTAHHALTQQFADRTLSRTYLAIVRGRPMPPKGRIETSIGRSSRNRLKMAVVSRGGKPATTDYLTVRSYGVSGDSIAASLIECKLMTGRTHQIRVHMAHLGCPILGDALYGAGAIKWLKSNHISGVTRQALHACALRLSHPTTGESMAFECSLPADFRSLSDQLEAISCDNS